MPKKRGSKNSSETSGKSTKARAFTETTNRDSALDHTQRAPAETPLLGEVLPRDLIKEHDATPPHPLANALNSFLSAVDDYRDAAFIAIPLVAKDRKKQLKVVLAKLDKFPSTELESGATEFHVEGPHAASELLGSIRDADRLVRSKLLNVMERSLFIGLFSEYDAFMGSLLQAIYSRKPELFRTIRREVALTDLFEFEDLQAVMRDMLEKEIDTFRRQSYVEQFCDLERKFEVKTLREFPEWAAFVEITQRRNVMTHNDGCVSQQYLTVCEREGYKFNPRPVLREKLEISLEYLVNAMFVVSKTAFMLAHTLWRKVLPDDCDAADDAFNATHYELLTRKRWRSAAEFGMFGLQGQLCKNSKDINRRMRVINTAIALKFSRKQEAAIALLDKEDWSAAIREFHLANAILKENYTEAGQLMRAIGKTGEMVSQLAYHDWPLFNEFRDRPEFQEAYEEIYGTPFMRKVSQEAKEKSAEIERGLAKESQAETNEIEKPA